MIKLSNTFAFLLFPAGIYGLALGLKYGNFKHYAEMFLDLHKNSVIAMAILSALIGFGYLSSNWVSKHCNT